MKKKIRPKILESSDKTDEINALKEKLHEQTRTATDVLYECLEMNNISISVGLYAISRILITSFLHGSPEKFEVFLHSMRQQFKYMFAHEHGNDKEAT